MKDAEDDKQCDKGAAGPEHPPEPHPAIRMVALQSITESLK